MKQIKLWLLCDGDRVADSLRELANAVEESENQLHHFETPYADAEIDWDHQDDDEEEEEAAGAEPAYEKSYRTFRSELLKDIKALITAASPQVKALDVNELLQEDLVEKIVKYHTPKDYPANFVLFRFALDKGESLSATGYDIDSDGEWEFEENDLSVVELSDIRKLLGAVRDGADSGDWTVSKDGDVTVAEYRHLGYYNDTEDLRDCTGLSDEEIIQMMLSKEGAFHEAAPGETSTLEEIRSRQAGRKDSVARVGDYLVVNQTKDIEDPDAALAGDNPDSPVFVDIYQLIKD